MRLRLLVAVVALGVVVAGAVLLVVRPWSSTRFGDAVATLPTDVRRATFTDWVEVAAEAKGTGLSAASPATDLDAFLDRAFDRDLTSGSPLGESLPALADAFGVTPLEAQWEIYGQGEDGSADVLLLDDSVDLDKLEGRFADLGYTPPPKGPGSSGVWTGTPELVAGLDVPLGSLQQNVAVLRDQRLLVMSDAPESIAPVVAAAGGKKPDLTSVEGVSDLVEVATEPSAATLWVGDFACEDLAMSQAGVEDQAAGRELVVKAGGVHPLTGLVFAQQPDLTVLVGMQLADESQAADDLQARADLARGAAPGQGGTFAERFRVSSATAEGRTLTLALTPVKKPVLADIGEGPVLFATC